MLFISCQPQHLCTNIFPTVLSSIERENILAFCAGMLTIVAKIPNSFAQTANARARIKTDLRFPEIPQPHYQHLDHLHQLHHFDTLF